MTACGSEIESILLIEPRRRAISLRKMYISLQFSSCWVIFVGESVSRKKDRGMTLGGATIIFLLISFLVCALDYGSLVCYLTTLIAFGLGGVLLVHEFDAENDFKRGERNGWLLLVASGIAFTLLALVMSLGVSENGIVLAAFGLISIALLAIAATGLCFVLYFDYSAFKSKGGGVEHQLHD